MGGSFKKVTAAVQDICAELPLTPAGRAVLTPDVTVAGMFEALTGQNLFIDAVRFLARALPKREAVWWACLCARDTLPPDAPPHVLAALQAAEAWVYKPAEENRRDAMARAEAAKFDSPSSWAAVAAFWSGGSLSPPGNPVVPPGDGLTGTAVAGAVMLAAAYEPQRAEERYRQFLKYGVNIAEGGSGREPGRS